MAIGTKQQKAAKEFAAKWKGKGFEKGESQPFWMELLQKVLLVEDPYSIISFENRVKLSNTSFIDAYIKPTHVLIEQKSIEKDLHTPISQSDGITLTPFRQAKRYADELPYSDRPRWIVICNFREFNIYDMENPQGKPAVLYLADLEKEFHRLSFLVDDTNVHLKKELEVSIQAGEIVGVLYEKFLAQYLHPENPDSQKSLNKLCVRLVFCLYAEDAGIFGKKNMFHDYMAQFPASEFRKALIELFQVLDTSPEDRDPYMDEKLAAFPFVSGGMFAGDIEIPRITDEIRTLILQRASDDFNWSLISPTIFGAVFESTLNPDTRRAGGMHYTSLENIHKVIDPLFLDDLKAELADIKAERVLRTKKERAIAYQDKLASLKFLDPACGSGNFLTESYTCLRRLENEAIRILYEDRVIGGLADPIKVSIYQFYGIEINDFACSVSQAALWIAETQMLKETDTIVGYDLEPLPLKDYHNIHEGNALRMDWNDVVPATEVNFIMGNPPFIGTKMMSSENKEDTKIVLGGWKNYGTLDYVANWYKKALDYMLGSDIKCAFVSTNSLCQGEQVPSLWNPMFEAGVHIDFAYRTFQWDSEAAVKAHVHCIIIGFSLTSSREKLIFDGDKVIRATNINGYLIDGSNTCVESRREPIMDVPAMYLGCDFKDDGNLVMTEDEKNELLEKEPRAERFIRPYMMGKDFIQRKPRYCIWLKDISPIEYASIPAVYERVKKVREFRLACPSPDTQRYADTPSLPVRLCFYSEGIHTECIGVPRISSQSRSYIPIELFSPDVIAGDSIQLIPYASLYHFGVIASSSHMAWMRTLCGRMKSDYRYSAQIVYNNLPWPSPSEAQKERIAETAQAIIDARSLYPECTLALLYDEVTMPIELRRAHRANDAAVFEAYGFPKDASESEIVARLFKMYQELTNEH